MAKFQKLCAYSMHWLKKEVSVAFLRNIYYVKSAKKLTVAFICIIGGLDLYVWTNSWMKKSNVISTISEINNDFTKKKLLTFIFISFSGKFVNTNLESSPTVVKCFEKKLKSEILPKDWKTAKEVS